MGNTSRYIRPVIKLSVDRFSLLIGILLVLTVAALVVGTRVVSRIAAISWLVYSVPHFVYHLRHLTMVMPGVDKAGIVVSLAVTVIAPIVVLFDRTRVARPDVDLREPAPQHLTPVSARR